MWYDPGSQLLFLHPSENRRQVARALVRAAFKVACREPKGGLLHAQRLVLCLTDGMVDQFLSLHSDPEHMIDAETIYGRPCRFFAVPHIHHPAVKLFHINEDVLSVIVHLAEKELAQ